MINIIKNKLDSLLRLLCLLCACIITNTAPAQDNVQTIKEIRDRGTLRVAAMTSSVYPFMFQKKGEWTGFDVQLASDIAKTIGVKLMWDASYNNDAELVAALKDNKADIALSRIKRNIEDAQTVTYTKPYITLKYVLMTNRMRIMAHHPVNESIQTLTRMPIIIGTLKHGDYASMATRRFPAAKITHYATMTDLSKALKEGVIEAAFCDEAEARFLFAEHPELGIRLAYYPLPELKSGVVIMSDWPKKHLVSWLNILLEPTANNMNIDRLFSITY